jgi:hypothetical protein
MSALIPDPADIRCRYSLNGPISNFRVNQQMDLAEFIMLLSSIINLSIIF